MSLFRFRRKPVWLALIVMLLNGATLAFALPGTWLCSDGMPCATMKSTGFARMGDDLCGKRPLPTGAKCREMPASSPARASSCCRPKAASASISGDPRCRFQPGGSVLISFKPVAASSTESIAPPSLRPGDLESLLADAAAFSPRPEYPPPADFPLRSRLIGSVAASRAPPSGSLF
jgi:hypothetical protein